MHVVLIKTIQDIARGMLQGMLQVDPRNRVFSQNFYNRQVEVESRKFAIVVFNV